MTTANAHNAPPSPVVGDTDTFPSHAELVRSLLAAGGIGSMTTMTSDGYPYGSLAAYSTLDDASPLVFISEMAEHTRNAHRDSRAGLFVTLPADPDEHGDPLDAPRASIVGDLAPYQPSDGEVAAHLAVHPGTHLSRLSDLASVDRVGLDGPGHRGPTAGPGDASRPWQVRHMNEDHADASLDMARHLTRFGDGGRRRRARRRPPRGDTSCDAARWLPPAGSPSPKAGRLGRRHPIGRGRVDPSRSRRVVMARWSTVTLSLRRYM